MPCLCILHIIGRTHHLWLPWVASWCCKGWLTREDLLQISNWESPGVRSSLASTLVLPWAHMFVSRLTRRKYFNNMQCASVRSFANPQFQQFARRTHRSQWNLLYSWLHFITGKAYGLKINQGKMCTGQRQWSTKYRASTVFSPCCSGHVTFPSPICDNTQKVFSTKKAHLNLDVQSFYWDSVMLGWLINFLCG